MPKVMRGRRPRIPKIDVDKMLSFKHLLDIKNYGSTDTITKATIDGNSLVVGTKQGKILKLNKLTFQVEESY